MTERELFFQQYSDFLEKSLKQAEELIEDISNEGNNTYRSEAQDFLINLDNKRRMFDMRNVFSKFRR